MNDALDGYKAEILPEIKATLTWDRDLVFTSTT